MELLGIQINNTHKFNPHNKNICKSAANKLNVLIRLKHFLSFLAKEVLINCYIISNFNYCRLAWIFSSVYSANKIKTLQKQTVRFLYDDLDAWYN